MLLVYTTNINNRLRYTFELIFEEQLGISFGFTTSTKEFSNYNGPKINYSQWPIADELFLFSNELLFQKGIKEPEIEHRIYDSQHVIFYNDNENSFLPFDPFAATFYMLSRYEEYSPYLGDKYGRFRAEDSLAYELDFLQIPVVNHWINFIGQKIKERFPEFTPKQHEFKFIPTYDIDIAFSYRAKGLLRNLGGSLRDLKNLNFRELSDRFKVMFGKQKDPYATYDQLIEWQEQYKHEPIYFFLIGNYGQYDKNVSHEDFRFHNVIQEINDFAQIGIHPSYRSNKLPDLIQIEMKRLSEIVKREITRSRQHYIKLSIPETYQRLQDNDILKDYTMGFPHQIGFRAGFAGSFMFYDISQETKTKIRVYPFAIMDVTLHYYMELKPEQATKAALQIVNEVKKANGLLMTIWHNHSLSERDEWKDWKKVYERIMAISDKK